MPQPISPQKLKYQLLTFLTKLSDRDTHSIAAAELESIAASLDLASVPTFLSCIRSCDSSKSPARKQCVHLLGILSQTHGNALSPYLSKILSDIIRRLRDSNSAVRSVCVNTTAVLSSHITKPGFGCFLKPLADALFTEQDVNSQIGAALCLAAAIEAAPDPEPDRLLKFLSRFVKLLKSNSFKAKSAVLVLIGSVIEVGGAGSSVVLEILVPCIVEFFSKEDWAARKAAAEALVKLSVVERDSLAEFKAGCLKVFENRRFDKVKAVREVMNQLVEAWKQVPDVSEEMPLPPNSKTSPRDSETVQLRKKYIPASRSTPPEDSSATNARRSALKSSDKKTSSAMCRKLNHKKPLDWNVEIAVSPAPPMTNISEVDLKERDENVTDRRNNEKNRFLKPETKRVLFDKNLDDRIHNIGAIRSGSDVNPCQEERSEITVVASNVNKDNHRNHKGCEELSLISKQLVQIEQQQSSLLDLVQKFIGNTQHGMHALETRVHGLERALDRISHDLAVANGRMTKINSSGTTCWLLPGADFLSSKFRRKTEDTRFPTSRFSTDGGNPSGAARGHSAFENSIALENPGLQLQGGGGFIMNPLAEIHSNSRGISDIAHQ